MFHVNETRYSICSASFEEPEQPPTRLGMWLLEAASAEARRKKWHSHSAHKLVDCVILELPYQSDFSTSLTTFVLGRSSSGPHARVPETVLQLPFVEGELPTMTAVVDGRRSIKFGDEQGFEKADKFQAKATMIVLGKTAHCALKHHPSRPLVYHFFLLVLYLALAVSKSVCVRCAGFSLRNS